MYILLLVSPHKSLIMSMDVKQASLAAEGGSLEGLDFMGTPPPKVFVKMMIIPIFCLQIPSPIFSDIPEDLFTTLSHLR